MKRIVFAIILTMGMTLNLQAQQTYEYKIITSVESIIPGGLGRSRIIENQDHRDSKAFTTKRVDGKRSGQGSVKRRNAKVEKFAETKLLNFYSLAGINFRNIASNDALIGSTINTLAQEGWELAFVTSGVEGDAGETDGNGIFVTRYIFKRKVDPNFQ